MTSTYKKAITSMWRPNNQSTGAASALAAFGIQATLLARNSRTAVRMTMSKRTLKTCFIDEVTPQDVA